MRMAMSMTNIKMGKSKNKFKKQLVFWLFAAPMLIYTLIFKYVPLFGITIAFKDYKYNLGIWGSDWVGFDNFKVFFNSPDCWRIVRNTLGYNAVFITTGTIAAIVFALILYEIKKKAFLKTYQTIIMFPNFISWTIVAYMVYALINPQYGLLKPILGNTDMYVESGPWKYLLTAANLWKGLGMNCLMYYASLMSIDDTLIEASKIDGANKILSIWHISLPHILPLACMLTILNVGNIFAADFGLFYQVPMGSSMLLESTDVIDTYIFRAMKEQANLSMAAAVDFFKSFIGLVCVVGANLIVRKINPDNSLF